MTVQLLPRLTAIGVSAILESVGTDRLTPELAKSFLDDHASMLCFAASGGTRSGEVAWDLGRTVRAIAVETGFPENKSKVSQAKFDRDTAVALARRPELATGEALRDDVWAYIAIVVLPDVVAWRFPNRARHRYAGGVRNAFQRLWSRGTVLDCGADRDGRWLLVRRLSEDAFVQVFERASIAGNKPLAVALAEGWVQIADRIGRAKMEPIMRMATKLLRLRNEVVDLGGLTKPELDVQVLACFQVAEAAVEN